LTDEEIQTGIDADPDSTPSNDPNFWKNARVVLPKAKQPTSIRLDSEVLNWFKGSGKGYQTRINAVLRSYMEAKTAKRARA
jgi:uncharacterized protein (DUF4415 family)